MFYDHFIELCNRKGVSPSRATVEAGINKSAVTYWKTHADAKPSGQIAERLCAYFGVSMSELYGARDQQKETPAKADVTFDDFTYAMAGEAKELTEESKQKLLEMARFFKEHQNK